MARPSFRGGDADAVAVLEAAAEVGVSAGMSLGPSAAIFADGFESGDASRWSNGPPPKDLHLMLALCGWDGDLLAVRVVTNWSYRLTASRAATIVADTGLVAPSVERHTLRLAGAGPWVLRVFGIGHSVKRGQGRKDNPLCEP